LWASHCLVNAKQIYIDNWHKFIFWIDICV
jgi:hypothetical protein